MKRIAVIGGGISGLSAAYTLQKRKAAGAAIEFAVFESDSRLGGVIRTDHADGCVIEGGPDSFLTEKPWAADLCRELGIADQLIASNDSQRKTYLLVKGRLIPIPDGLMFMVPTKLLPTFFSPLFSWKTKLQIIREWFSHPRASGAEETVSQFVGRHYGREMVERVADPLLGGVYGGSADKLSVSAVLPRFVQMELKYGSLGRAMVAARKNAPANPKPLFTSLRGGMQQLIDTLVAAIPNLQTGLNAKVEAVKLESGKWLVVHAGRTEEFDAVVLATSAQAASAVVRGSIPALAIELQQIEYSSSITVVFAYDHSVQSSLPPGFGFLVPRSEHRSMLAATFVHNKFPHRAPDDRALIRCFLSGEDDALLSRSDNEIIGIVNADLQKILRLNAKPVFSAVHRWPKAMAQYGIGHSARISRITELVSATPGLALAGNAYSGIGVPDCVRAGTEAAQKVVRDLGVA